MARLVARLRGVPADARTAAVYDDVVSSLGFVSQRRLGLHVVALDAIVGTVDRRGEFDRRFRPMSKRTRARWESIATAMRRGEPLPAVVLLKIGETYFVQDGHNRVSVARELGRDDIDAYITEVATLIGAQRTLTPNNLPLDGRDRHEPAPLPSNAGPQILPRDPRDCANVALICEA
jgi:hypothetical protein